MLEKEETLTAPERLNEALFENQVLKSEVFELKSALAKPPAERGMYAEQDPVTSTALRGVLFDRRNLNPNPNPN